jgi:hypothetical protein
MANVFYFTISSEKLSLVKMISTISMGAAPAREIRYVKNTHSENHMALIKVVKRITLYTIVIRVAP